jgi:hypothetical protein
LSADVGRLISQRLGLEPGPKQLRAVDGEANESHQHQQCQREERQDLTPLPTPNYDECTPLR